MKEILTCIDCEKIICVDIKEGERLIGQTDIRGRWITFPENVENCPRRVNISETEWHVPEGRPDLMMPINEKGKT